MEMERVAIWVSHLSIKHKTVLFFVRPSLILVYIKDNFCETASCLDFLPADIYELLNLPWRLQIKMAINSIAF